MSQWGKERHFIMPDDGVMSVIAHVEGPTWEPLHPNHKIDDLIMSNCSSDIGVAQIILTDLKNTWIGRTHQEWCNSAKPVESITQLRPGTIIRHVNGHEGYIVIANYGDHAIAVRTKHISNPREWLIVEE